MTRQISFSKFGNRVLPAFRNKINKAESTEDLKKFFVYTIKDLFDNVFTGELDFDYEDIALDPSSSCNFTISERLLDDGIFVASWKDSDLPKIVGDLAGTAMNRYKHLGKNPAKSEAKIRK
jgi:hypothetical protein